MTAAVGPGSVHGPSDWFHDRHRSRRTANLLAKNVPNDIERAVYVDLHERRSISATAAV